MKCPKCGGENCQIITETQTKGKDFSAGKGCCGWVIFGPMGILCGMCGEGKKISNKSFWVCHQCGNKFKV